MKDAGALIVESVLMHFMVTGYLNKATLEGNRVTLKCFAKLRILRNTHFDSFNGCLVSRNLSELRSVEIRSPWNEWAEMLSFGDRPGSLVFRVPVDLWNFKNPAKGDLQDPHVLVGF